MQNLLISEVVKYRVITFYCALFFLLLLFFVILYGFYPINPKKDEIILHKDEKVFHFLNKAKDYGAIRNISIVRLFLRITGKDKSLKSGVYELKRESPFFLMLRVLKGESKMSCITIFEGQTTASVIANLGEFGLIFDEDSKNMLEGYCKPDTYCFRYGSSAKAILDKMKVGQLQNIERAWNARSKVNYPLKNRDELLIMASIVEKESKCDKEKPFIAAVFLNRLRKGMRLQSDVTAVYEEKKVNLYSKKVFPSDLKSKSPYNTYIKSGLPLGPISNPGFVSLQAVANPADTDFLYFVSSGERDGHVFSSDFKTHLLFVHSLKKGIGKSMFCSGD